VSGNGAFEDEMDLLRRQKPADDELAAFAQAAKATLLEEPDRAAGADLVPRLAEAARASAVLDGGDRGAARERPRAARRGWAPLVRVGIAIALVPLLSAGLAFAGVNLPDPANDAFESVGVELPNQASPDEDGDGEATGDDSEDTSDAGEGPGNAAENGGHGMSKSNPAREGGRANGKNGTGRALGKRGLAPGQLKPKKTGGGQGNGNALGRTGSTPPGQAKVKPEKKSTSSGGGSGQGAAQGQDQVAPPPGA
jgi:hypothetical protein